MTDATAPLRIAVVAPVAQSIPPERSGSIETLTAQLVDGLVARGHDVTLFATGTSRTAARLEARFAQGYREDPTLWPWEFCEVANIAAAVAVAADFDVVHCQAEYAPLSLPLTALSAAPMIHTVHHLPQPSEVALWNRDPDAVFSAVSQAQASALQPLTVIGVVPHGVDTEVCIPGDRVSDALLFLGRFTEGKGVLPAIEVARRAGRRIVLAAEANEYYHTHVAPIVDGDRVQYIGELSATEKVRVLQSAAALIYPVQQPESFGLVLAEAAACGTPVVSLNAGAAAELVDDGVTGVVCGTVDEMVARLPLALALDRIQIRRHAEARFSLSRMTEGYEALYRQHVASARGRRQ